MPLPETKQEARYLALTSAADATAAAAPVKAVAHGMLPPHLAFNQKFLLSAFRGKVTFIFGVSTLNC